MHHQTLILAISLSKDMNSFFKTSPTRAKQIYVILFYSVSRAVLFKKWICLFGILNIDSWGKMLLVTFTRCWGFNTRRENVLLKWSVALEEWSAPITPDDCQLMAWTEAFEVCVVQHGVADFWQRSVWWSAGYVIRCCQGRRRDGRRGRWGGIGRLLGGGGMLRGEIDLSPAANSHCMSPSDGEHYSQSQWINSTAAPHDPSACPQTNYLIHKRCMMGEPREPSILKPPITQVSEDLLCKESAAYRLEGILMCWGPYPQWLSVTLQNTLSSRFK